MTKEQEKKMTSLLKPLVEQIVKKQKLNEVNYSANVMTLKQSITYMKKILSDFQKIADEVPENDTRERQYKLSTLHHLHDALQGLQGELNHYQIMSNTPQKES